MTVNNRVITLSQVFYEQLAHLQEYIEQTGSKRDRILTSDIVDFVTDVVAVNPYMFVEFALKPTPEKIYRRAVFRRTYVVLYKVTDTTLDILALYHTSQHPDSMELD